MIPHSSQPVFSKCYVSFDMVAWVFSGARMQPTGYYSCLAPKYGHQLMKNLSSSFTAFSPQTLTIQETYSFTGTDCTYDVTIQQEIEAGGTPYFAIGTILEYDSTPIPVTYYYPNLTLSVLSTVGPSVIFVTPFEIMSYLQYETYIGGPGGGGSQTYFTILTIVLTNSIFLPQSTPVMTTSRLSGKD